jgi:hypothetical protein
MPTMIYRTLIGVTAFALSAVACTQSSENSESGAELFARLSAYCGQSFEGEVTSTDPRDEDWASSTLTIEFRECSDTELRVPLHVDTNRSRTWVISRTDTGLRLKHDHRHEDGSEDILTQYGGDTETAPTSERAEFPADQFSKDLFEREGIPVSMDNTWSITLTETTLTYALDRPERHFEVTFDLATPVDAPPAPWGFE